MSEHPTPRSVIELVRAAFAGVAPGRMTVHEAEAWDSYGTEAELCAARKRDPEREWTEVDARSIAECTTALSHLDRDGWRFYLPAYMVWTLEHIEANSIVIDHTIYSLDLIDGDAELRAHQMERFESLNEAQSRAVCRFLRYMAMREDRCDAGAAQRAIEAYWSRFDR